MSTIVVYAILTLACYRYQRLVTRDEWPPSEWWRGAVERRFGSGSSWFTLFTCHWCFGLWVCGAVFAEHHHLGLVPIWVHGLFAASAVVGILAEAVES